MFLLSHLSKATKLEERKTRMKIRTEDTPLCFLLLILRFGFQMYKRPPASRYSNANFHCVRLNVVLTHHCECSRSQAAK